MTSGVTRILHRGHYGGNLSQELRIIQSHLPTKAPHGRHPCHAKEAHFPHRTWQKVTACLKKASFPERNLRLECPAKQNCKLCQTPGYQPSLRKYPVYNHFTKKWKKHQGLELAYALPMNFLTSNASSIQFQFISIQFNSIQWLLSCSCNSIQKWQWLLSCYCNLISVLDPSSQMTPFSSGKCISALKPGTRATRLQGWLWNIFKWPKRYQ